MNKARVQLDRIVGTLAVDIDSFARLRQQIERAGAAVKRFAMAVEAERTNRRRGHMFPVLLAIALALPPVAAVEGFDAAGIPANAPRKTFPERRWYCQSQAWWRPADGDHSPHGEGEHIHVEAAVPIGQTISGVLSLDVRIQLHEQPAGSEVTLFRVIDDQGVQLVKIPVSIKPDADGNADVWLKDVRIDTRRQKNGRREYRLTANMSDRADGKRQYQSTGWCWYCYNPANGEARNARSDTFHEARGWYTGADYANARFASRFPFEAVRGRWTFNVSLAPGSGGEPVTAHMVTVDPDFHGGRSGLVVKEGAGKYVGAVSIDTTRLANGIHRLVLISHQSIETGRNSGVLVIPFVVANPAALSPRSRESMFPY